MRDLIDAVNVHRQRQEEWHDKIMSGLEEANVTDVKNYDFEFFREEVQKGAKKVIFGQRNGSRVQSAKKNFCTEHAKMLDRNKC